MDPTFNVIKVTFSAIVCGGRMTLKLLFPFPDAITVLVVPKAVNVFSLMLAFA